MANANVELWRRAVFVAGVVVVFALASGFGGCPGYSSPGNGYGPTNPPFGAVVATPNPLNLTCGTDGTFAVSQLYYSGSFTPSGFNMSDITVTATSPPNTFVVHALVGTSFSTGITMTGGGSMSTVENVSFPGCVCVRHHDMWGHTLPKQTAAGLLPKECPLPGLSRVHVGHRAGGRVH